MARMPLFIVLVSFVHYGSSSTNTTIQPSATITSNSSPTGSTPTSNSNTVDLPSNTVDLPSNTVVSTASVPTPSGHVTSANTSQIVATPASDNVTPSSAVPTETPAAKKFEVRMTVQGTYKSAYTNISSNESITFINDFKRDVKSFLDGKLSGLTRIVVKKLTNGSVVVDFDILAQQSSNATKENIVVALKDGNKTGSLGYTLKGDITVKEVNMASTSSIPSATAAGTVTVSPTKSAPVTTAATPTCSAKGTEFWDKAIDLATPMGTFIIVVVAVALIIILLIALICVCCKYRILKRNTQCPEHMAINNDSEWIRSSDDLLMWERNLRATEVKATNGITNRPFNDKRT